MTAQQIIDEIKPLAKDSYKKVLLKHGIHEPVFGVSVEELKKIQKRVKVDYQLALDLFETGIYDAMYLAGLIADDPKMTKKDLQKWVTKAAGTEPLCSSTVAWVAAGSPHGREIALEWIDSRKEGIAIAGWGTLSSMVATKEDADLDLAELKRLLDRVQKTIHEPDGVAYAKNGFIIAVGTYVAALTPAALATAEKIGTVTIDMGETSCKVPAAADYIRKAQKNGKIGKKRKTAKC